MKRENMVDCDPTCNIIGRISPFLYSSACPKKIPFSIGSEDSNRGYELVENLSDSFSRSQS